MNDAERVGDPASQALLDRARSGDAEALSGLVTRLRPLVFHVANRHGTASFPADDLASSAMLRFLEAIARGGGPTTFPESYVSTVVRNLAIDHARSRTARTVSVDIDDVDEASVAIPAPQDDSGVELMVELGLVRRAFARLTTTQRRLLQEIVVGGRKPGELAQETGQRSNTVSVQLARARSALGVQLRLQLLERAGGDACAPHRAELAKHGRAVSAPAREHLEGCGRCRSALGAFAAIPAVLVCAPALVLAGGAGGAAIASRRQETGQATSAAAPTGASGGVAAVARRVGTSRAGLAAVAGGIVLAIAAAMLLLVPSTAPSDSSVRDEDASATVRNPVVFDGAIRERAAATDLVIDLDVRDASVETLALDVELPSTMSIVGAPADWDCSSAPGGGRCTLPAVSGVSTITVGAVDGPSSFGAFTLTLEAASGILTTFGTLEGTIVVRA